MNLCDLRSFHSCQCKSEFRRHNYRCKYDPCIFHSCQCKSEFRRHILRCKYDSCTFQGCRSKSKVRRNNYRCKYDLRNFFFHWSWFWLTSGHNGMLVQMWPTNNSDLFPASDLQRQIADWQLRTCAGCSDFFLALGLHRLSIEDCRVASGKIFWLCWFLPDFLLAWGMHTLCRVSMSICKDFFHCVFQYCSWWGHILFVTLPQTAHEWFLVMLWCSYWISPEKNYCFRFNQKYWEYFIQICWEFFWWCC